MKKAFTYSALVLLLAATACNKTESVSLGEGGISFAPASVETRALIEDAAGLQAQTFQVYDLLDGASYINETISYADGAWNYASGDTYTWKNGAHKFFGYTSGAGELASNVLTVSKTLTTADADQVDLLYSEIFSTTAADWKATAGNTVDTPVALHMKHLFSAVSITLKNCTDFEASVTKVTAPAIPNAGSATVSYAGNAADVTYTAPTVSGNFVSATPISSATALASQKSIDVLKMAVADAKGYQMVWPQTLAEGEDAVTVTVSYTLNGTTYTDKTVTLPADTWEAGKKYDYELQILPSDIRLIFQVMPWDAKGVDINSESGSINMSNVTWQNTVVTLNQGTASETTANTLNNSAYSVYMYHNASVQVIKRDSNGEPIHQVYAEDTVGADGKEHQAGDPVVDEYGNPTVYEMEWKTYDYYPAQGYFTVNYPKAGKYRIGLIPAYGQTTVNEEMYEIYIYDLASKEWKKHNQTDGESISNKTVYFQVRASENVAAPHPEYKAQIDIWFKADGSDEWISGYSEIRANYACIIPAVN